MVTSGELASDTRHWESFQSKAPGTAVNQIQAAKALETPESFQTVFIHSLMQRQLLILVHSLPWAEVFNRETQAVLHKG